jgi:SAM-dependent methyltransferase
VDARHIEREWLDHLAPADPRALRARRDLRRINSWMLQSVIMARLLIRHAPDRTRKLLDLGAGDGTFLLRVARRLGWRGVTATLVDRHNAVSNETLAAFNSLTWNVEIATGDVIEFLEWPAGFDVISVNLFLHHLADQDLVRLMGRAAQCAPLFVACEPERAPWAHFASRQLWAIGCGEVTRHDAPASVRAGFAGRELSSLWPKEESWELHERARLFTHCFVARKKDRTREL